MIKIIKPPLKISDNLITFIFMFTEKKTLKKKKQIQRN